MNSNFRNTELCTIGNTNHKNKKFPSLKCLIFYQVALSPGMGMKEHQTFLTVWEWSSVLYTAETLSIFQTTNWAQRPGECLHDLKKLTWMSAAGRSQLVLRLVYIIHLEAVFWWFQNLLLTKLDNAVPTIEQGLQYPVWTRPGHPRQDLSGHKWNSLKYSVKNSRLNHKYLWTHTIFRSTLQIN